jgi:hypothetical protein
MANLRSRSEVERRHIGLVFVATLFRVGGVIASAVCLFVIILVTISAVRGDTVVQIVDPVQTAQRAIGGFLVGTLFFAFGELLIALNDIALNTRFVIQSNKRIIHLLQRQIPRPGTPELAGEVSDVSSRNQRILEELERALIAKPGEALGHVQAGSVTENQDGTPRSSPGNSQEPPQSFADALASNLDEWVAPNERSISERVGSSGEVSNLYSRPIFP